MFLLHSPLFEPSALNGNPALRGSGYRRSVPVPVGFTPAAILTLLAKVAATRDEMRSVIRRLVLG